MVKKSTLKVNDRKWREIKRRLPEVKGAEVRVGLPADSGSDENGTPLVAIAVYNEFGTRGGGWGGPIPARPFLGTATDENRDKWGKTADAAIDWALTLKGTFRQGLNQLGTEAQGDVKKKMTAIKDPPNSPVTIAMKGSSNPLIASGNLRAAVTYEVKL